MSDGKPGLKCVIAWSDRRNVCSLVADALEAKVGARNIIQLGDDSFIVYGASAADEIRNWVAGMLEPEESVMVLEFEKWSGHGPGVGEEWLMRRGH